MSDPKDLRADPSRGPLPAPDESAEHEGETVEAVAQEVEVEDPDLEAGEELETEDFSSDGDPMLESDVEAGEAEGVLEENEAEGVLEENE